VGEGHPRSVRLPRIGVLRVREDTRRLRRLLRTGRGRVLSATVSRRAGRWVIGLTVEAADLHPAACHPPRSPGDRGGWTRRGGIRRPGPAAGAEPSVRHCRCRGGCSAASGAGFRPTGTTTRRSTSPSGASSNTPRPGTPRYEARTPTPPERPALTHTQVRVKPAPVTEEPHYPTPPGAVTRGRPRRALSTGRSTRL
jgi:hypothetical protein